MDWAEASRPKIIVAQSGAKCWNPARTAVVAVNVLAAAFREPGHQED